MSGISLAVLGLFMMTTPVAVFFMHGGRDADDFPGWLVGQGFAKLAFFRLVVLAGFGALTSGLLLHAASIAGSP